MFNGGCEIPQPEIVLLDECSTRTKSKPYVKILEQPAPKALRFRYECEGRSAGSLPGASSTPDNKTFPTIQIIDYRGKAVVVVSCVTKDKPYRPHPHNLVGREGCQRGVCTLKIPADTMTIQFCNLGIQCVKKKDIEAALRVREEIRVDPYRTGFSHRSQPTSIDLNSVRLCFQVFLEGDIRGKFTVPLDPVVSEPIYDKKAMSELVIVKMSDCSCPVDGDRKEIILLCEKIAKEDIQVRFYEERHGMTVWEDIADFQPSQVHKQVAISFRPPRYHNPKVTEPVRVNIQLRRPSDGATSDPLPFEFHPVIPDLERKRKKPKNESILNLGSVLGITNDPAFLNIKSEPREGVYPWPQGGMMDGTENMQFRIPNIDNMPSTSHSLTPQMSGGTWNLPYNLNIESNNAQPVNTNQVESSVLPSLWDMDTQNTELKQINLNSGELGTFEEGVDVVHLSETFINNVSLTDLQERPDQNMTDSLTRLANNTIESLCQQTNNFK